MARDPSLLDSNQPLAISPAQPAIAHVQLRDLLICPREQGVVDYIVHKGIVEQDMHAPGAPTRVLSPLSFTANSLTYLLVGVDDTLIAAGGQEREIHLSYYTPHSSSSSPTPSSSKHAPTSSRSRRTRQVWEFEDRLTGSINNSVLLTSLSLTRSNESSVEPRVGVSNNDGTVRLYDVPLRVQSARRKLREVGEIRLDVAINHSSISPDGRTLLSVGDSNKVYFHQITGGSQITFSPILSLTIPPPDFAPFSSYQTSLAAAFSTAFSGDGSKFAVASQEGVVAVWDVRSTKKAIKVWQTDKTRGMSGNAGGGGLLGSGNAGATGWLSDDPWEWTRGTKAPGWCVRSVKFNGARTGKEVMAFTEHTSLVHVVDARTFETHDIIRVPTLLRPSSEPRSPPSAATSGVSRRTASSASVPTESVQGRTSNVRASAAQRQRERILMRRGLPVSNARRTGSGATTSNAAVEPTSPPSATSTPPTSSPPPGLMPPPSTANPSSSVSAAGTPITNRRTARSPPPASSSSSPSRSDSGAAASSSRLDTRHLNHPTFLTPSVSYTLPHSTHPPSPLRHSTSGSRVSSRAHTPGIVQALGDAFRIALPSGSTPGSRPASAQAGAGAGRASASASAPAPTSRMSSYSPPASIGDSTWRTLGGGGGVTESWMAEETVRAAVAASRRAAGWDREPEPEPETWRNSVEEERHNQNREEGRPGAERTLQDLVFRLRRGAGAGEDGGWGGEGEQDGQWDRVWDEDRAGEGDGDEGEGIVVVPDLGDRDVESEVHALLANHGIQSRLGGDAERDEHPSSAGTGTSTGTGPATGAPTAGTTRTRAASMESDERWAWATVEARVAARRAANERAGGASGEGSESESAWLMADIDTANARIRSYNRVINSSYGYDPDRMDVDGDGGGGVMSERATVASREDPALGEDIEVDVEVNDEDDQEEHDENEDVFATDLEYLDEDAHHLPRQRRHGFHHYAVEEEEQEEDEDEDDRLEEETYWIGAEDLEEDLDEEDLEDEDECDEPGGGNGRRRIRQGGLGLGLGAGAGSSTSASTSTSTGATAGTSTSGRYGSRAGQGPARDDQDEDEDGWLRLAPNVGRNITTTTAQNTQNQPKRRHPGANRARSAASTRRYGYYEDLDLAGMCFDPWGERMYVLGVGVGSVGSFGGPATFGGGGGGMWGAGHGPGGGGVGGVGHGDVAVGAVVEWGVRGAEKRWWVDDEGWM